MNHKAYMDTSLGMFSDRSL